MDVSLIYWALIDQNSVQLLVDVLVGDHLTRPCCRIDFNSSFHSSNTKYEYTLCFDLMWRKIYIYVASKIASYKPVVNSYPRFYHLNNVNNSKIVY